MLIAGITVVVIRFVALFSCEFLSGHYGDQIIFDKKGLELNGKLFSFSDIDNIHISINHFDRERLHSYTAQASLSNGVDNKLSFRVSGLLKHLYFKIYSKDQLLDIIEYLKLLDNSVEINLSYKGTPCDIKNFDPKIYKLIR